MEKISYIQTFNEQKIRSIWDGKKQQWFFSVNDVAQALVKTNNVTDYLKKLRKRDNELAKDWDAIIVYQPVQTRGGLQQARFANKENILRIAKATHSLILESFTKWLSEIEDQAPKDEQELTQ